MESIVSIQHLVKSYKDFKAVDDLSFDVKPKEIIELPGPNGSGKSTTIHCLLGLLNYKSGHIQVCGKDMKSDAYDIKRKIGDVFHNVIK